MTLTMKVRPIFMNVGPVSQDADAGLGAQLENSGGFGGMDVSSSSDP